MTAIKLTEQYAVASLRADVRDSLVMAGEPCVLLQLYHPEVDTEQPRCPECYDDVYAAGENACTGCYGTGVEGGIKAARRVQALFSDSVESELLTKQGMWPADAREIQTEAFPLLLEHDVVVRVRRWDDNYRPTELEGYYNIAAVIRTSLRTGSRLGQYTWDVVGQRAAVTLVNQSHPITQYPILSTIFPEGEAVGQIVSPPPPSLPTTALFYPSPGSGGSSGAFTHSQVTASATWTIDHPLDHLPSVTVIINQELVEPDVTYVDDHTVVITFAEPQTGFAVLV